MQATAKNEPFKIETHIPPPASSRSAGVVVALHALANAPIGASVWVPMKRNEVPTYNTQAGFRGGWYVSREEGEGRRIWKLSEPVKRSANGAA